MFKSWEHGAQMVGKGRFSMMCPIPSGPWECQDQA